MVVAQAPPRITMAAQPASGGGLDEEHCDGCPHTNKRTGERQRCFADASYRIPPTPSPSPPTATSWPSTRRGASSTPRRGASRTCRSTCRPRRPSTSTAASANSTTCVQLQGRSGGGRSSRRSWLPSTPARGGTRYRRSHLSCVLTVHHVRPHGSRTTFYRRFRRHHNLWTMWFETRALIGDHIKMHGLAD